MSEPNTKKAFTLIELLVVIAIIGILVTIAVIALNSARSKARDAKRVANIKQVQTALELFFNDKNRYPTLSEYNSGALYSTSSFNGTTTYMEIVPEAPTPPDGNCTNNQNQFSYTPTNNGGSYTISYCLGNPTGSIAEGPHCATPSGVAVGNVCGNNVAVCVDASWTPDPNTICYNQTFSQTSNCGNIRDIQGTKADTIWTPDANTVCNGESFNQTGDCGGSRTNTGSLTCNSGYICNISNNTCEVQVGDSFSCPGTPVVQYDNGPYDESGLVRNGGGYYRTVQIGSQCWLRDNLNIGTRVTYGNQLNNGIIEKYCYADNEANCDNYGGLYAFPEMVQYLNGASVFVAWNPLPTGNVQGICPVGWHVPTYFEHSSMVTYLGGWSQGYKIKASSSDTPISWNGLNITGFTAIPGGYRSSSGYSNLTASANIMSATDCSNSGGLCTGLSSLILYMASTDSINGGGALQVKSMAFGGSVRCIKD